MPNNLQAVLFFLCYSLKSSITFQNKQLWFSTQFKGSWKWEREWEWHMSQFTLFFGSTLSSLTSVIFITVCKINRNGLPWDDYSNDYFLTHFEKSFASAHSPFIIIYLKKSPNLHKTELYLAMHKWERNEWDLYMSLICSNFLFASSKNIHKEAQRILLIKTMKVETYSIV